MRYAILSDIHSNIEALEAVMEAYENESIDTYLCVGDIVGYAANPRECIKEIKIRCSICVAGNHDWASVNLFPPDYFNQEAKEALYWTRRNIGDSDKQYLESLPAT